MPCGWQESDVWIVLLRDVTLSGRQCLSGEQLNVGIDTGTTLILRGDAQMKAVPPACAGGTPREQSDSGGNLYVRETSNGHSHNGG